MNAASAARLLALAAIWGGSFVFVRVVAPVLGPTLLVAYRVGLAALFLLAVAMLLRKRLALRAHWRHYLIVGFCNSTLPFLLFGFAAETLPASLLAILNATAPIWGALVSAAWMRTPLARKTVVGLVLGVAGVMLLVGFDPATLEPGATLAVIASLCAALSYGVATTYTKAARKVDPFDNAHGSMWAALLLILPAVPFFPAHAPADVGVMGAAVALGVVCTGVAYLLYFRLIKDLGAAPALTVTFLIPVFGVLWGWLFLDEPVGWYTVAGSLVVIVGTALVTGFTPARLRGATGAGT